VFEDDKGLQAVISRFELAPAAMLGYGGEAVVFALDDERVLRILWEGAEPAVLRARQALVDELAAGGAPFSLPELDKVGEIDGRWYAIERRLRGRPVAEVLATLSGRERDLLHGDDGRARRPPLGTSPVLGRAPRPERRHRPDVGGLPRPVQRMKKRIATRPGRPGPTLGGKGAARMGDPGGR
jgi:hypothetical protein